MAGFSTDNFVAIGAVLIRRAGMYLIKCLRYIESYCLAIIGKSCRILNNISLLSFNDLILSCIVCATYSLCVNIRVCRMNLSIIRECHFLSNGN